MRRRPRTSRTSLRDDEYAAGLRGDWCTAAEIAERLVLSVRTVDHHVSAVLAKLGVTGRHEAAGVRRGAASPS